MGIALLGVDGKIHETGVARDADAKVAAGGPG